MFKYSYDDLFNPTLKALHNLGGSATVGEIEEEVASILKLSEEEIIDIHQGNRTKFSYRLAWTRTYLKNYGLLENSSRGVWSLNAKGMKTFEVDISDVKSKVKLASIVKKTEVKRDDSEDFPDEVDEMEWQDRLLEVLKNIDPGQFERLCQRLLRELGFINVEVTGKSGDGGIDGKGVLRLGGVLSFHVVFQAKRFKGSVSSGLLRDFRGGMIGKADKGLFITTGTFTSEAKKEAQRDGAPPIDLIDGNLFTEKLKELGLGVGVEMVEKININEDWFKSI